MLMPILRLVLIYVVLIIAVLAVFNRDKLARLVSGDPPAVAAPAPHAPAQPEAPAPSAAPTMPSAAAAPPTPAQPAAPPAPGVLQTPQAAPAQQPAPAPQPAAPETAPQSAPPQAPGSLAPDLAEALNAARSAYWSGDIAGAGAQLAALAAAHPDNADLHGELGNFRFANRDYTGAAEAFLRAGELLIGEGRSGQAASLMPVLGQIAPDKAQALATLLQNR